MLLKLQKSCSNKTFRNNEKYAPKEGITAETIRDYTKVQPINSVAAVSNSTEKKHLSSKEDVSNAEDFKRMLAEQEKKLAKKEEVDENHEEQEHTAMEKMNCYNNKAKEISFYMTMATKDIKC